MFSCPSGSSPSGPGPSGTHPIGHCGMHFSGLGSSGSFPPSVGPSGTSNVGPGPSHFGFSVSHDSSDKDDDNVYFSSVVSEKGAAPVGEDSSPRPPHSPDSCEPNWSAQGIPSEVAHSTPVTALSAGHSLGVEQNLYSGFLSLMQQKALQCVAILPSVWGWLLCPYGL